MSKSLQLRRGTTAEHQQFIGLPGEITIDTDLGVPVIHDGVTAGGKPILSSPPGSGSTVWKLYTPGAPIVSKDMLLIDTSAGPVSVTLPVGVYGESVGFMDLKGTFGVNPLTINSTGGATFLGTASPLVHSVSRTIILTSVTNDWRF